MKRVWCLAFVVMIGCGEDAAVSDEAMPDEGEAAEASDVAPAVEIPPPTPTQALMRGHYRRASEARDALIRADIDGAREHMTWLATHDEGSALSEELRPRLDAMQAEADRFADASTMTEAGLALAQTLVRCGDCHQASGGGFVVALPPLPSGEGTAAHMQRHLWAAERMWEGLVMSDDDQFSAGANSLEEVPLRHGVVPSAEGQADERVEAITALVHELGRDAQDATTSDERARIYGRYLATCGTCHRLLGRGPVAPVEPTLDR